MEAVWFRNNDFNGGPEGAAIGEPQLFGIDLDIGAGLAFPRESFGLLCLVVLIATAAGVAAVRQSRFGTTLMAVRVNERAAAAAGTTSSARSWPCSRSARSSPGSAVR